MRAERELFQPGIGAARIGSLLHELHRLTREQAAELVERHGEAVCGQVSKQLITGRDCLECVGIAAVIDARVCRRKLERGEDPLAPWSW